MSIKPIPVVLVTAVFLLVAGISIYGIEGLSNRFLARYVPGYVDPEAPPQKPVDPVFEASRLAAINEINQRIAAGVSRDNTEDTIQKLGSLTSRVVGYPGNREAFEYVKSSFQTIGLQNIKIDTFQVTIPVDKGGHLTVDGSARQIPVHALWPNRARTSSLPPEGINGPLVYAGKGSWPEFNGGTMDGAIVLMDFDSGDRYLNARMLGAQAVVFFDNGVVTRGEAEQKSEEVPLSIPRFWIAKEEARFLIDNITDVTGVHLVSKTTWETVETWNVYGYVYGSDDPWPVKEGEAPLSWRDKTIVVQAHYDAMSVVPALAPGAESAGGIAGLLQAASVIKQYRPGYTYLFLATSAHFEALAGVSDFVYRHARTGDRFLNTIPETQRIPIDLFIGLDFSSGSDQLTGFALGVFDFLDEQYSNAIQKHMIPYSTRLEGYARSLFGEEYRRRYTDGVLPNDRTPEDLVPSFIALDHEIVNRVGLKAMSLVSTNDIRDAVDTPADYPSKVRVDNLTAQIKTATGMLLALSRDEQAFEDLNVRRLDLGHDLWGRVVEWDRSVDFFRPRKVLPGALVTIPTSWGSYTGVRTLLVTIADKDGEFRFNNIPPMTKLMVRSYMFDEGGEIVYANDRGEEGAGMFPIDVANTAAVTGCVQVLFKCEKLDLLETIDPAAMDELSELKVLSSDNNVPRRFGHDFYDDFGGSAGVVYIEPGLRVKVLATSGPASIRYLMTNAPEEMLLNPIRPGDIAEIHRNQSHGFGYEAGEGFVKYPMYETARNMWVLDDIRLNGMIRHGVKNDRADQLHRQAYSSLMNARTALAELDYSSFVAESRKAWGLEVRAYPDIKATADDTVKAVIFYFILVLPFAYFIERIFFAYVDIRKQMATFGGIFLFVFLVLQRVHPAFKLSLTPYVVFLSFIIMTLGVIVIFVLLSKFDKEMKKIKHKAAGVHEADIGRLSAMGVAVNLGISNLRKRKMRSCLTAVTLILLTFTVLSFTSYSTKLQFFKLVNDNEPGYQGALVRDPSWLRLDNTLIDYLESAFEDEAILVPRGTWMARFMASRVDYKNSRTGEDSFVTSLMCMSPEETLVTGIDKLLLGNSRWFVEGDREVCILPLRVAERVGINQDQIGQATIEMMGKSFLVIGMIEDETLDALNDLDDERVTPISFVIEGSVEEGEFDDFINIASGNHLGAHNTLIIPYDYGIEIDGSPRSVAMIPVGADPEQAQKFFGRLDSIIKRDQHNEFYDAIEDFLSRVSLAIFVGRNDNVTVYSTIGITDVAGLEQLIIPILIAALLVLNTMMGAVHERFKEIGVYSAVGLAPSHVAVLFLAEACVFATIGVVVGYLLGQVTTMLLTSMNLLEGLSLNYSSMSAVLSAVIVLIVVILSAAYPAKKAADMSVQDVSRKWELPEPVDSRWSFEFPFTVSRVEALALCAYLTRVFQSHEHGVAEGFVAEETELSAFYTDGMPAYRLDSITWIAPFDLGVSQGTSMEMTPLSVDAAMYQINVTLQHKSGDYSSWVNLNRAFLKLLRKRFLVWRTMGQPLKDEYHAEGKQLTGSSLQTAAGLC